MHKLLISHMSLVLKDGEEKVPFFFQFQHIFVQITGNKIFETSKEIMTNNIHFQNQRFKLMIAEEKQIFIRVY